MSTPNTPTPASPLSDRMNKLSQQISLHESAINRSARITTTVGLIGLVALSIYFYFGYTMIAGLLEPEQLVPYGAQMLSNRLPEARKALVTQISNSAPAWANEASVQARKEIPGVRVKLETYVMSGTDELLGKVTNLTEEHFRKALRENHDLVENGFKELANSEKLSDETLNALVTALEQELKSDMKTQAETVLETLRYLSDRVQRLSSGKGLDEQERYMRLILMIARRMRDTTADETPIKIPELKPLEPAQKADDSDKPAAAAASDGDKDTTKEDKPKSKKEDDAK